ncbi:hypothetical protein [Phenylobacterium sp.]|uniref:hypothetical protein n=1 Tax=Phenylobacterium sp. TaxID=1871053 RepID=UPI003784A219
MTIAVVRQGDGWRVFGPAGFWRHFAYRVDAEEAALHLAARLRAKEARVVVLVQSASGEGHPISMC